MCEGLRRNDDAAFKNAARGTDHAGAFDIARRGERQIDLDASARMLDGHRRCWLGLREVMRDAAVQTARHGETQRAGDRVAAVTTIRHEIARGDGAAIARRR